MDPKKTAVIVVDNDNDFLTEGGKLHGAVKSLLESNNVVANINDLIAKARDKGSVIVHVPLAFSLDYREMGKEPYGIFKAVKDAGAFQKGSWGAGVADVIDTQDSDIVVEGKSTTCAFATTDLKKVLDENGITTVALCGLLTNICIETTMRTAYDAGHLVYTLTDCCATLSEEQQRAAIEHDWPMFSKPVNHNQFIEALDKTSAA